MKCQQCGADVATAGDVLMGRATYADTQGGHDDRHTLVVEAAERIARATPAGSDSADGGAESEREHG